MNTMPNARPRRTTGRICHAVARVAALVAILLGGVTAAAMAASDQNVPTALSDPASRTNSERSIKLFTDFVVLIQIPGDVATIVLGNADIADANLVSDGMLALTGHAVGTTNVVILGLQGEVLAQLLIHVGADKPGAVTVRRATMASSYACTGSSCLRIDGGPDLADGP